MTASSGTERAAELSACQAYKAATDQRYRAAVYNTDTKGNTTIDDFLTQRIQPYQSDSGIIYHDGDTGKFSHAAAKAD